MSAMTGCCSLKAVAPVQIRSGLQVKCQVKGLTALSAGRPLIICHWFVIEFPRHLAAAGGAAR
jgi:hypothetical protein